MAQGIQNRKFKIQNQRAKPSRRGRIFVISSPSGGGKTTVVERLCAAMPRLVRSVSVTTRLPRPGERPGHDYHFVPKQTFQRLRRSGQLLEWAQVHGASYGTPKRPVVRALAQERDVIVSLDVQGARAVRRLFGARSVLIFLAPPSMRQLRSRLMRRRTETAAAIRRRLAVARRELACARWYDHTVVNDRLQRTISSLTRIITKGVAHHGTSRHRRIVEALRQRL